MFLETLVGSSKLLPITVYEGIWTIQAISKKIPSKFPPAKTHRPKKMG